MSAGKGPTTTAANVKPATSKLLLELTKLVQDELPPGSPEVRILENSCDQDNNNVRLLSVTAGKRPKTATANGKPASDKLSLASTKVTLKIG